MEITAQQAGTTPRHMEITARHSKIIAPLPEIITRQARIAGQHSEVNVRHWATLNYKTLRLKISLCSIELCRDWFSVYRKLGGMEKFVVIVFPNGLQGQIWAAILRSQNLSVIWESPDVALPQILKTLHEQQALPDLLILDTRLHHLQPYRLCRWCQRQRFATQILLVNGAQPQILPAERQWARAQAAADLLPRIAKQALVSGAASNLQHVLDILGARSCNQRAMVKALLRMGLGMPTQRSRSKTSRVLKAHSYQ